MKDYASLRKSNKSNVLAIAALALCVILSATMLFSRLMVYSPMSKCQYIPLTQSNGITHVTKSVQSNGITHVSKSVQSNGITHVRKSIRSGIAEVSHGTLEARPLFLASPGFEARDENTVWSGETDVEIFSIQYDNESGETTVRSKDGTKVLAPGTGSTYEFALENTGKVALDYTLEMEAWFSDAAYPIPVVASVVGHEGEYLLGSAEEMVDVLRLEEVRQSGTVAAGNIMPYALNWEWPFELDDAYDTMLGNLAVEEDLTLTVVIRTTATYSHNPDSPGGIPPQTGDTAHIELYAIMMVASLAGVLMILLLRNKEKKHEAV